MDIILENLGAFWGFTEVQLDALAKKGQLAEQYVAYGNSSLDKPKLYARFMERITEYKSFWIGVQKMCATYMTGNMKNGGGGAGSSGAKATDSASEFSSYADDCFGTHTEYKSTRNGNGVGVNGNGGMDTNIHMQTSLNSPSNSIPRVVTPAVYGTPTVTSINSTQYDMSKIDSL